MEGATTAFDLGTALVEPLRDGIMGNIESALPVVAGIAAVMIGITVVMKLIKKGTKG